MSQPPPSSPGALYEIRYGEICPWLILVRSLRVALLVRVLLLAFLGVLLTQWGWSALDRVLPSHSPQLPRLTESPAEPVAIGPALVEPGAEMLDAAIRQPSVISKFAQRPWVGPLVRSWAWLTEPFVRVATRQTSWSQCLALSLSGAWAIAVWAVFGGAIARIAALYLTRGETLGPGAALQAALSKWVPTVGGPLITLIGAAALAVPLVLAGLLMRFDLLALLAGLVWALALVWGLMLAVVLLGLLLGWPLMWATVGVERTDAFDGVSRCYAYVYQRPLQLVFYLLVATALGLLGETAVHYLAIAGVTLSEWSVSWGSGNERAAMLMDLPVGETTEPVAGMVSGAANAIAFWNSALLAVAASFPLGYLWSAAVGIYLLLRRHIDSTEMDEIVLEESPQPGLPPFTPDQSGIPQVDRPASDSDSDSPGAP